MLEYLGIVAALLTLVAALTILRRHAVERSAPVRPVPVVSRLLDVLRDPPREPRGPAARRPSPRRPRPPRAVIDVPRWLVDPF